MDVRAHPTAGRLPSLDGVRAVAIGTVCLSHVVITEFGTVPSPALRWLEIGDFGVQIFFVLSGFLITTLLLRERDKRGRISLRTFYFRRTLRIFPAFYFFLIVIVLLTAVGWVHFDYGNALSVASYASDYYVPPATTALSHCWSLAVEEQFYLIWPIVLVFLAPKGAQRLAIAVMILCPLIRLFSWAYAQEGIALAGAAFDKRFDTHADALAAGCLLALLRPRLHASSAYLWLIRSPFVFIFPIAGLLFRESAQYLFGVPVLAYLAFEYGIASLCIAVAIDRVVTHPSTLAGRWLNGRWMVRLGVLSYSLYLWQQIFLIPAKPAAFAQLPWSIPLAVLAASLSYFLVERPFLRLRERIEPALFTHPESASGARKSLARFRRTTSATSIVLLDGE